MHGLIANQLRSYTIARHGRDAWSSALLTAGSPLPDGPPALDVNVPDEQVMAIVSALAISAGTGVPDLLRDFGVFLASALLRVYAPLVPDAWRTLDVVEHVEAHIHTAIRLRDPRAGPPRLRARRVSPRVVEVLYTSPRRLCVLAEGIVRGLAEHYGEPVAVSQPECMHRGDTHCLIVVELTAEAFD